jgi:S1-C subfamily serine protease
MEELQKRMEQLHKRMQQFQRRGRMDLPGWPAFPNQPLALEPRALSSQESRLGVQLGQPGATLVNQLDLLRDQGMVVEEVGPNAPAAKAGLKQHDILLEVDGKPVPSKRDEFDKLLGGIEANRKVEAAVMRKGKKETIKGLTLPEAKPVEQARPALRD